MLDFNNPQSQNIVIAATYIDRLRSHSYDFVVRGFEERQQVFKEMISVTDELLEFSETAFPESLEKIKRLCEEVIIEIGRLQGVNEATEPDKCKVCNGELSFLKIDNNGTMVNVPLCSNCSRPLIRRISELEKPTGVWAI